MIQLVCLEKRLFKRNICVMRKIRVFVEKIAAKVLFDKKLLVFESYPDFSDNTMIIYNELVKRGLEKKYKMEWCVHSKESLKNKKYKTFLIGKNVKFYLKTFSAKRTIYSHFFIGNSHSKRQERIFLLHGMSFKDAGKNFWPADFNTVMFTLSEMHSNQLVTQMPGSNGKCRALGFPRNDLMNQNDIDVLNIYKFPKGKKLILWLPTFRRSKCDLTSGRNDYDSDTREEFSLLNDKTLLELDKVLQENNCVMIVKYHPSQDVSYITTNEQKYSNILSLTARQFNEYGIHLYKVLAKTDGLIADFSSVYIDYLLKDCPIAFDITDMDSYSKGLGFSVDNPLDYMPGHLIRKTEDICTFIKDVAIGKDTYSDKRKKVVDEVHTYKDFNSTERIINSLEW